MRRFRLSPWGRSLQLESGGMEDYYCDSMLTDKQKLQEGDGLSMASEDGEVEESCPINHSLDRAKWVVVG